MRNTLKSYPIHISLPQSEVITVLAENSQAAKTRAWNLFKSKRFKKYKFRLGLTEPKPVNPFNILFDITSRYEDEELLKADGFDDAVIGIDENSMRLIYSCKKCIEILMQNGMSREDAIEHFGFNVTAAYMGEKTPIWCDDDF